MTSRRLGSSSRQRRRLSSPPASSAFVLQRMRTQRRWDTSPELVLRRLLWACGVRYRVNAKPLPTFRRRADLVLTRPRIAVFVDGCFWHACPLHATWPKTNAAWWRAKLRRTTLRDRDTDATLVASGWRVLRFWEHDDPIQAASSVQRLVSLSPRPRGRRFGSRRPRP
jgi:DNA mismatch endonuclease (patch repair protein)